MRYKDSEHKLSLWSSRNTGTWQIRVACACGRPKCAVSSNPFAAKEPCRPSHPSAARSRIFFTSLWKKILHSPREQSPSSARPPMQILTVLVTDSSNGCADCSRGIPSELNFLTDVDPVFWIRAVVWERPLRSIDNPNDGDEDVRPDLRPAEGKDRAGHAGNVRCVAASRRCDPAGA